jgi:hypothetical protein
MLSAGSGHENSSRAVRWGSRAPVPRAGIPPCAHRSCRAQSDVRWPSRMFHYRNGIRSTVQANPCSTTGHDCGFVRQLTPMQPGDCVDPRNHIDASPAYGRHHARSAATGTAREQRSPFVWLPLVSATALGDLVLAPSPSGPLRQRFGFGCPKGTGATSAMHKLPADGLARPCWGGRNATAWPAAYDPSTSFISFEVQRQESEWRSRSARQLTDSSSALATIRDTAK